MFPDMLLKIHSLKSSRGAKHRKKRVGRGNASGHGTYSGRGCKGQRARSGGKSGLRRKGFRSLMLSTPKLRGFHSLKRKPETVCLGDLDKRYIEGETVDLRSLKEKGMIHINARAVKVLRKGALTKKLVISGLGLTKGAAEQIQAAGGEIK